jgi:ribosomal-protein-alanine N-acetyltransferase
MATLPKDLWIPQLAFRRMAEEDVSAVIAAERAGYAFPWSEGIFRDCLRAGYVCRVAELDDLLVGYGILSVGAGEAHVLNLCVRPEYRCRGLGRRLLQHLIDLSRAAAAQDLFLEVRPSNLAAVRLYQAMGLQQVGVRRGYYQAEHGREDAVVMRLTLNR